MLQKYLSSHTPGNVWRESLLEPAQKPVNSFAVSGTDETNSFKPVYLLLQ